MRRQIELEHLTVFGLEPLRTPGEFTEYPRDALARYEQWAAGQLGLDVAYATRDAIDELFVGFATRRRLEGLEPALRLTDRQQVPTSKMALGECRFHQHARGWQPARDRSGCFARAAQVACHDQSDRRMKLCHLLRDGDRLFVSERGHRQIEIAAAAQPDRVGRG